MKVLTLAATIVIPLTFLDGIYGMNFQHMLGLHVRWAYPIIWTTMLAVAGGMLTVVWKQGWIGPQGSLIEVNRLEQKTPESRETTT